MFNQSKSMVKPPKSWIYIEIQLEIDGVVVESKVATQFTFDKIYAPILYEGQTQQLPWAIFILKFYYQRPKVIGAWRDRDRSGKFIKSKPLLYENERP